MRSFTRTVVASLLALAAAGFSSSAHAADANNDHIVVMISVDGLAGFYYTDPKAEMPNIRAIGEAGAAAPMMKAVTPTVTWPNHTTLVTGDYPARHGVVGNNYFNRETGKRVQLISDPTFDKDQIVKVPTIYDLAHQAGMKTVAIRWPATRNASTLDWTLPDTNTVPIMLKYTTPSLIKEGTDAGYWDLGSKTPKADGEKDSWNTSDKAATQIFNMAVHEHRPQLALLHIINVDHTEHQFGPRTAEAYAAVKEADGFVGQVWDELKKDFPGKATLLVVSDHGFSPITHSILPNVALRDAGLISVKGIQIVSGDVRIVPQGGACLVYIMNKDKHDEVVDRTKKAFAPVEGIASIVDTDHLKDYGVATPTEDPHAPDMVLFAKMGYSFGDTAAGALSYKEKPELTGTHGHDPNLPDLHATFVAWGEGIQQGAKLGEVRNIDVAPTLASLLHIQMPNTDGKPITGALIGQTTAQAN